MLGADLRKLKSLIDRILIDEATALAAIEPESLFQFTAAAALSGVPASAEVEFALFDIEGLALLVGVMLF